MFYYGYISKFSYNQDKGILNRYLDYSIENNFEIKNFFTETNFFNDDQFEKCEFSNLLNKANLQNSTIIINNCLDISNNLIELSKIHILLYELNIKIEIIECNSNSLLIDGLNKLGYSKPKPIKFSKISEAINLKSSRGAVLSKIPIGYEKSTNGKFKINENEKLIVRKIFKLYSGNYGVSKRVGLRKISNIISQEFKDINYKMGPQTIKSILKNRFYTGVYLRDSKIISGNHDQIITTDEYNFIKEIFKNNFNANEYRSYTRDNNKYLDLLCKYCNSKLNISYHSRKWILKDGTIQKKKYNYVECMNDCKFKRKRIELSKYIDEGYMHDSNIFLIKYKSKLKNLRANIKLLIRGKLSLTYFKNEIENLNRLENLLKLNSGTSNIVEDIKSKQNKNMFVKL